LSELDEAWALALAEAEQRARVAGRNEVAEYLALRNSNDLLRKIGIEWLITTFTSLAAQANRVGSSIQSSTEDGHRFRVGHATMVGSLLTLRYGVRTLTIEAGWPRAPRDGIVRGGGLACANIKHLGIKSANEELLLIRSQSGKPRWVALEKRGRRAEVHEASARNHIAILLDEP
jgi:hypothetical protein